MPYTPPSSTAVVLQFAVGSYTPPSSTTVVLQFAADGNVQTAGQSETASAGSDADSAATREGVLLEATASAEVVGAAWQTLSSTSEPGTATEASAPLNLVLSERVETTTAQGIQDSLATMGATHAASALATTSTVETGTQTIPHAEAGTALGTHPASAVMVSTTASPATASEAQGAGALITMSESEPSVALATDTVLRSTTGQAAEATAAQSDAATDGVVNVDVAGTGTAEDAALAGNGLTAEALEVAVADTALAAFVREFYLLAKKVTHVLRGAARIYVLRKPPPQNTNNP